MLLDLYIHVMTEVLGLLQAKRTYGLTGKGD